MFCKNLLSNLSRITKLVILGWIIFLTVIVPSSVSPVLAFGAPPAPNPVSPDDGAVITPVEFPPVGIPEVEWTPVGGATKYRVQFSNDIGFTTTPVNITTPNTTYTPIALSVFTEGLWYWRVRVESSESGASVYSNPVAFTKQWATGANKPALTSPTDGATLDFYDHPSFSWTTVIGAASYQLEIDTDDQFTTPLSYSGTTLAPSHQPLKKLANGVYYWRVVPLDAANRVGTPSEARTVTIYYNFVPTPLEPLDNSFPTFTPTFKWTAVQGAEYYRLEYSTDPAFPSTSATTAVSTRNTSYTPPTTIKNDVNIYWRVRAHSGASISDWSQVFTFQKHWYLAPTLLTPTNNYLHTRFPVWSWTPVPGAARYYVEVNDENNFQPPLCQQGEYTSQTMFTIKKWVVPCTQGGSNTIFWRVTPYDGSGNPGKSSSTFSFFYDQPTVAPDLVYPLFYYPPDNDDPGDPSDIFMNPNVDRAVPYPIFTWQRQTNFVYPGGSQGGRVGNAYRVQVSTDPLFFSVDWEHDTETLNATPSDSFPFTPQEGVDYYWRVCAVASLGSNDCLPAGAEDHWSQRWITRFDFTKAPPATNGNAPELMRPRDGLDHVEYTPRLDWFPFQGAASYQVQISADSDFSTILDSATVTYPTYAPAEALAERHLNKTDYGTFYWRVKADNDPDWSDVWRFQIASQGEWLAARSLGAPINRLLQIAEDPDDVADNNFELTTLYGAQDDDYWYFGFTANTGANMTYALYFDIDYTDNAGGTSDPRGYDVTAIPAHRPEYVLYIIQSGGSFSAATTALYGWTGSSWGPPEQLSLIGGDLVYDGAHLEVQIPSTAIGYGQESGSIHLALMSLPGTGTGSSSLPTDVVPDIAGTPTGLIERFTAVSDRPQLVYPFDNFSGDPTVLPFVYPFYFEQPTGYDYNPSMALANSDTVPVFSILEDGSGFTESRTDGSSDSSIILEPSASFTQTTPFSGFVFEAYTDPEFTSMVLHVDSDSTANYYSYPVFAYEYDLQGDNSYYWRYRIRYLTGPEFFSPWSEGFGFERKGFVPQNLQISVDFATPTFSWDLVEGAEKYRLQVDDDPNFGSPVYNIETTQNTYTPVTTLGNGTYYWRVQAKRHTVTSYADYSPVQSFVLTLPVPQGLVHYPAGVVGRAPTLCWDPLLETDGGGVPVLTAWKYRLQFSLDASFSSGVTTVETEQNCHTPIAGYADGTYYWHVAMIDGNNRSSEYSPTQVVTKQYPVTTLIAPLDGGVLLTTPTFEWTAVDGAASYRLEVSTSPTFAPLYDSVTTNNVRYTPVKLYANNIYYWRVAIIDKNNKMGPFNDATIILDPSGLGNKSFLPIVIR